MFRTFNKIIFVNLTFDLSKMFAYGAVGFILIAACYGYPHPQVQFVPVPVPVPVGTGLNMQFPVPGLGQPGFGGTNFATRFGDGGTGGYSSYSSVSSSSGPFGGKTTITSSDPVR